MRLSGKHVVVTSGPTVEPIDPVRYLSNRSSGKQGHAIAAACAAEGANVTLITGPVTIPDPSGVTTIHVTTAKEMMDATLNAFPADIAVCAAAVADWTPATVADHKMKKRANEDTMTLSLVKTGDILKTVSNHEKRPSIVVGFAAETNDALENAKIKRASKGCDVLLVNDVSGGKVFGEDTTHLYLITADGITDWGAMDKTTAAKKLVETITTLSVIPVKTGIQRP